MVMKKKICMGLVLLLACLLLTACGGPEATYKKAQELLSQGKYAEAAEKFESIGSFEDASTLTIYCKACALCEAGEFETGISALEKLGDYKDSPMRITYYTARSWDDGSIGTTEFEWMEKALSFYGENPLYLDSTERIAALKTRAEEAKIALYEGALAEAENGKYTSAQKTFKRLGSFKDSKKRSTYYGIRADEAALSASANQDKVISVAYAYEDMGNFLDVSNRYQSLKARADKFVEDQYARIAALTAEGKCAEAEALLASFGTYGNEKVTAHYYAVAEKYLALGEYDAASAAFKKAGKYSDAADRIQEPYYKQAVSLMEEEKWEDASAVLKNISKYSDAKQRISYCGLRLEEEGLAENAKVNQLTALADRYIGMGAYLDCPDRAAALNARATAILDAQYDAAVALMNAGKYEEAKVAFNKIRTHKDSASQIKACETAILDGKYDAAVTLMNAGKYSEAEKAFAALNGYKDSANWSIYCKARALELTANSESSLKQAQKVYESISGFEDSSERATNLYHQRIVCYPDYIGSFSEGLAAVEKNLSEGPVVLQKDNKWGFIDKTGRVVIEPQWDFAWDFSEGLAYVNKDGKYGFIDKTGKVVIEPQWDDAWSFSEGLARVEKNGKYGFIDKTGKVVIEPQWDSADDFSEGLAVVEKDNKRGFIDKTGRVVIELQWDWDYYLDGFSEGLAAVKKNNEWGFIDETGKVVIEPQWYRAYDFSEGLATVEKIVKRGFIDKTGQMVIQPQWYLTSSFSEGLARVKKYEYGKWGFIDKTGKVVIEPQWDSADDFSEGLARVEKNGKYGFIDKTGKVVSEPQWDSAGSFSEGLAAVKKDGKYSVIDTQGNIVLGWR